MIFKVSSKVKSSLALNTLKCSYDTGSSVSIDEKDLYAADIRAAIDGGLLIPSDKDACGKILKESSRVEIINPTDKVMVLGSSILRPNGSLTISREMLQEDFIRRALESGHIVLKEDKKVVKNKVVKKKVRKIVEEDIIKKEEKVLLERMKEKMAEEEKPTTPVTWNLRTQEAEEAKSVDKNKTPIKVEADNKKIVKKLKKKAKKKSKKKTTKKSVKKSTKKKDNKPISKKDRIISPSGEKRLAKTAADAAVELDSRGNPLNKASDALNHLIDDLSSNQIGFVDEEQKQDRFNKRDF